MRSGSHTTHALYRGPRAAMMQAWADSLQRLRESIKEERPDEGDVPSAPM
jgi:hypothetical protein